MSNESNSKKNKQLTVGSEVLQALFENGKSPLSEQFLRWKLWRLWPDFVGSTIGQISEPVSYNRGVLHIWVKNASWLQQMVFMREPLMQKINQKLNVKYVKDIRLTLDKKSVPTNAEDANRLRDSVDAIMSSPEEDK